MNLIVLFLTLFMAGGREIQITSLDAQDESKCISEKRITKPIVDWKVISTSVEVEKGETFMVITLHNPLNSQDSVDARLILEINKSEPSNPQKYNLVIAVFYNQKTTVAFRRIYEIHKVKDKKKEKPFPIQTPCFSREIRNVVEMEPIIIK